ncbi:LOW QUALITY PROTEIN: unconventional myosin-XVIIIb [Erinaceus europaeus]|uniref:LOW QUALITY PROTEIN: unconventional myosin-XVIIIb n=1 Tax=Erinaceus europaeus TaxID=9365 RepID=A0ABM3XIJ5_ERIEU|nr:LOW QUALITY PROTEIN: unconventional myosin-XVIIIb [Erinaceus europaeus]
MAISSRLALWEQKESGALARTIREEDKSPPPSSPPPLFSVIPGGFIRQLVRETEKEAKEARRKRQAALASPEQGAPEAAASEPDGKPRDQPSAAWQPDIPSQESGGAVPADPVPMAAINGEKPPDPPAKRSQPFRRGVRGGDVLLMVARLDPDMAKPEQRSPLRDAPTCKTSAAATDPGGVQRGAPLGLPRGFQAGAEDVAPKGEKTQSGGAGHPRSMALNMDKKGQGPVGREGMPPRNKGLGAGEPQVKEGPAEGPRPAEKEGGGPLNKAAKGGMSKDSGKEAGSQRQGRKWGPSLSRRSNWGDTENQGAREAELPSQGDGSRGAGGATETGAALRIGEKAGGGQSVPGRMEGSQDVPEKPRDPQSVSKKTGGPQDVPEKPGDPQSMSKKTGGPQDVPEKPGDPQSVSKKTGGPQDVPEKPGDPQSMSKKTGGPQDVPEKPGDPQSMSKKTGGPQDVPEKPGDPQSVSKKTGGPQKFPENPGLPQSVSKKTGGSQNVSEEPGSPQSVSGEIEGPQNVSEKRKGGLSVSREAEGPQGGIELGGAPQGESQEAAEAGWRVLKDSGSSKVRGGGEPPASAGRQGLPDVRGQEAEASREGADQVFLEPECQVQGPELREDQDRPLGGQSRDSNQAPEDRWYEAEKVWLVQKDEFALATVLKPDEGTADLPAGRVRLCLDADKTIREVDEDHVHRANPPELDQVEDLASLISVNESSVLHTLLCRHRAQLHHTCLGPDLIVLQPQGDPSPGAGKVPALVGSLARRAYRALLNQRRDQSVVALGRSGAGKTACCRQVLEQLVLMAGSVDGRVSVEKIRAAFTVLRAFGSVTTAHSRSATRFSMVMALDFSPTGRVTAAQPQTFLLEKSLGARPPEGEGNFQVFSQMLAGLDLELRTELNLHQLADGNAFGMGTWATPEDKQQAAEAFARLRAAMDTLGIVGSEQQALWRVLAAIYHLGAAGTCKVGRKQFMYFEGANRAAEALGCGYEELNTATFKHHLRQIIRQVTSGTSQRHPGEEDTSPGLKMTGVECLDGVASGMYQELFAAVVSLINRSFSSPLLSVASIMVVDSAGFQNPRHQGRERAAGFEELCRNYAHERLQLLGHQRTFLSPLERAREEGVPVRFEAPESPPQTTVALLDQSPSQLQEKCVEELAAVRLTLQGDLETSIRRIADLQAALVEAASSDSDDESVKTAVDYGGKKETDTASSFCSQAEGSLQSWLSCTLSLPPDALRTPSRQSALSTHSLGSRLDEEAGDATRTPCFLNQAGDVRSKTSGLSSLGHQKPCPSGDSRGLRRDGRIPSPAGSDKLPSPSAALSEFVEGLRRKRGQRGGGPELGLEDWPTVPNYRTTGAASLRRARVASERGAPSPTSGGGSPLEPVGAASAGKSPCLLRSSSLRCIPLGGGERSPLFPESQKTRFSSCDSLLESTPATPVDRLLSPTLCPRRRCLEASLEEAGFPELGKEPLVFQNRQFVHLTQDGPTSGPFSWRQRETRVDLDNFLPAIRMPGMPADGLDRPQQPSIHFETEDADCSLLAGIQTAPRESLGAREDPAHLSDSSSSSSPGLSFKRPGSIRPRIPRPEGDGGETTAAPQDRECGAGRRDEDVESIMKKYLQK